MADLALYLGYHAILNQGNTVSKPFEVMNDFGPTA